jgi:hypothetical protein
MCAPVKQLLQPGQVVELRILNTGKTGTISGYFDDPTKLINVACRYSGKVPAIYITLNPVNPALLSRAHNKIQAYAKTTTGDADITARTWLPIDIDPVRPAGISSTTEEKEAAKKVAQAVRDFLQAKGWHAPVVADSGNGWHLLYRIDLPNDAASRELLKNCLEALDLFHSNEKAKVDLTTFNAARIWKAYGTMACKGDNTADRPHRLAKIISCPEDIQTVPLEKLKELAGLLPKPEPTSYLSAAAQAGKSNYSRTEFNLADWITSHNLPVAHEKDNSSGRVWVLNPCPFDANHQNRSAYITQLKNGAIGAGCHHDSCHGKGWHDLRDMYEPGWRDKRKPQQLDSMTGGEEKPGERPWPDPEPIETTLYPVEPIPEEIIPGAIRPWVVDIAFRMQCPLDFTAAAAMVVGGAVIGAGCGIRPKQKDDWLVVPNLWGGIVARPSFLKTPALNDVQKPLQRLELEAKERFEYEQKYYEAEQEVFKAQKESIKHDMQLLAKGKNSNSFLTMGELKDRFTNTELPDKPVRKRFKTHDATVEKLGELLNENIRGILLFRDELVGLLASWDREDRKPDRAFFLEAWNGFGTYTTDRIGRGTIDVANTCISILGGIQPSKLTGYLYQTVNDVANDGLLQRFQLLVYPDEPTGWRYVDKWPDKEAKNQAFDVFKKLASMDFCEYGAILSPGEVIPCFHFTEEAQAVFIRWLTELEEKLRTEKNPLMVEHLAKYRSLMPGLALVIHLVEVAAGNTSGNISYEAALQGAAWCEYLESHARRIYGLVADVNQRAAAELAVKIKEEKVQAGFSIRDIYRHGWHLLDTKELAQSACEELEEAGWLREENISSSGRPAAIYSINPKIFSPK